MHVHVFTCPHAHMCGSQRAVLGIIVLCLTVFETGSPTESKLMIP